MFAARAYPQLPSLDANKLFRFCRFTSARAGASSDTAGDVEVYGMFAQDDGFHVHVCIRAAWKLDQYGEADYERAVLRLGLYFESEIDAGRVFLEGGLAGLADDAVETACDQHQARQGFTEGELAAVRDWRVEVIQREEKGWATSFEARLLAHTVDGRRVVLGFAGRVFGGRQFEIDELLEGVSSMPAIAGDRHGRSVYARQLIRNLKHVWLEPVRAGVAQV